MVTLEEPSNMKGLLLSGWGLAARPCDTCRAASALLYCRADAAFLCGPCDASVHVHARSRHERVWMCEVCEQAPAAVTCKADAAALCAACDRDIHSANPLARRHERVPVVPFVDSTTVAAALRSSVTAAAVAATDFLDDLAAVPTPTMPTDTDTDTAADAWLIPNPNFLYNNDSDFLDFCNNNDNNKKDHRNHNHNNLSFQATDSVVPTQSTGNLTFSNATTTTTNHSFENFSFDIDFSQPNKHHHNNNKFISSFNFSSSQPSVSSEIGVVPDGNANSTSEVSYSYTKSGGAGAGTGDSPAATGAPAMDREARVLRYREKRKNRKFEKTIRYASRKAYAETRPRIKGRFAKRTESNDTSLELFDDDRLFGLAGYGVVPTF